MDYVIHTFGGQDLLAHIFNGLARIFQSNSEYFTPVGKFAMTIGGVWAAIQAIFHTNLGLFGKRWFFPSLLAFTFLFTPKATVWLKDDIARNAPIKIDNIPFAVAFFSSLSSKISYALSELIEEQLLSVENIRSQKAGLMFGAKLVGKMRDVVIQDPVLLDNTKSFCKQCFTKPWVMGNILGKRQAALASNDIMKFIKDNIPNNFGIYYKDPTTHLVSFKTCKEAVSLIETGLATEMKTLKTLEHLGASIGFGAKDKTVMSARIAAIARDTLDHMGRDNKSVHDWMKQAMMLNANRESIDDWRESFGHQRVYPSLVKMNSTRGLFQQSFGYIIGGEMAAEILPLMQAVLFSIIICAIFIVFPFAMLPGGMTFLVTWIKMLLWVNSWSVFFAILNCIGMFILSLRSTAMGGDHGLSILSQGGYAEMVLHTYAIVQLFAMMVPFVSWQILSKGGEGLVHLADRLSPMMAGAALGSAAVDQNISLDNISVGSRQIAQQNVGPQLNEGSRVASGLITTTQSPYGASMIQEHLTQGSTSFNIMDSYNDTIQQGRQESIGVQESINKKLADITTKGATTAFEYSDHVSKGLASADSWSSQDQINLANSRDKALQVAENYGARNTKSTTTSSSLHGSLGFSIVGNGIGLTVGTDARNSQDVSKEFQSSLTDAEKASLNKYLSFAQEGRFTSNQDHTQRLGESVRSNFDEQQQLASDLSVAKTVTDQWTNAANQAHNAGASIQENVTDSLHKKIMQENNLDAVEAMNWLNAHPLDAKKHLRQIAEEKYGISMENTKPNLFNQIHDQVKQEVPAIPSKDAFKVNAIEEMKNASSNNFDPQQVIQDLSSRKEKMEQEKSLQTEQFKQQFDQDPGSIQQSLMEQFENKSDSTVNRATGKSLENIGEGMENAGAIVAQASDYVVDKIDQLSDEWEGLKKTLK